MALHRCAACGSPNVATDTQAGGISYNYKKGVVGTVVLGAGGAVAGIENKTQTVYKCADCGMVLSYPMDAETKNVIDLGVRYAEARENLKLYGISVSWDFLKNKYKNIEEGHADEMIRFRNESEARIRNMTTDFLAEAVLEKLNAIIADLAAYEKGIDNYDELQFAWEQASKSVLLNREKALAEAVASLNADIKQQLEQVKSKALASNRKLETKEQSLTAEKEMLTVKLSSLGLFKFAEKKATQNRIEEIEKELAELSKKVADLKSDLQKEVQKLKDTLASRKEQLSSEIEKKYPLAESPLDKKAKLEFFRTKFDAIKATQSGATMWLEVAPVIAYGILAAMQDFSDEKGISISHMDDTDWEKRNINPKDADPVFKKVSKKLLENLGCVSVVLSDKAFDAQQFSGNVRLKLGQQAGLVSSFKENGRNYYVVK